MVHKLLSYRQSTYLVATFKKSSNLVPTLKVWTLVPTLYILWRHRHSWKVHWNWKIRDFSNIRKLCPFIYQSVEFSKEHSFFTTLNFQNYVIALIHWQNVKVKNANGKNVNRQNLKKKTPNGTKCRMEKKRRLWQKVEEKNIDWDKMSERKM